jgi:hypothetical protein
VAQQTGRHAILAMALGALRPLRTHLLGLWAATPNTAGQPA